MSPLLEVQGLRKRFGGLYALSDLEMHVDAGEIVSVIGPNGAGKTTLFNMITGLYEPDGGDIVFEGQSVLGLKPNAITRLGIARTFQTVHLFPNMTVLENAMVGQHCRTRSGFVGAVLRLPRTRAEEVRVRERAKDVLSFFGSRLSGYRHDQAAITLSYANRTGWLPWITDGRSPRGPTTRWPTTSTWSRPTWVGRRPSQRECRPTAGGRGAGPAGCSAQQQSRAGDA